MIAKKPTGKAKLGSYITMLEWMVGKLELTGDELIIYSIIYSFSQDGQSCFKGSIKYLEFWTGKSKPTILKILKSLLEKKLINKTKIHYTKKNENRYYCEYRANLPPYN